MFSKQMTIGKNFGINEIDGVSHSVSISQGDGGLGHTYEHNR